MPRKEKTRGGRSPEEDRELLAGCVSGEAGRTEAFVRRFSSLVHRTTRSLLLRKNVPHTTRDIEDLHNDVFLLLFENDRKKLRQYRGENGCAPATWVRLVAVRAVLNHLRKKGMDAMTWRSRRVPMENVFPPRADREDARAALEKAERERLVREGVRKLPSRERLFMQLYFDKGLSLKEVAEALGASIKNTYTIKHRTIQRLKSIVRDRMDHAWDV